METHNSEIGDLVDGVVRGEMRAISRAIQMVENRMEGSDLLLDTIYAHGSSDRNYTPESPALPRMSR